MPAELACFEERCRARFPITEILYNCPRCGGLLEAVYPRPADRAGGVEGAVARPAHLQRAARPERRLALPRVHPVSGRLSPRGDAAGGQHAAARRAPGGRATAGWIALAFKHQGFNPTGSFKDNGMTCGVAQARATGRAAGGVRFHRQHLGFHGGLCQRRRPAADYFHPARQHLVRQAGAGAGVRRAHAAGGGQFRPDPGAGAAASPSGSASTC